MDESSIFIYCPSACTYTLKGSKRVKVNTHGGDMVRLGLVFCGLANGEKLKPMVMIIRK